MCGIYYPRGPTLGCLPVHAVSSGTKFMLIRIETRTGVK